MTTLCMQELVAGNKLAAVGIVAMMSSALVGDLLLRAVCQ